MYVCRCLVTVTVTVNDVYLVTTVVSVPLFFLSSTTRNKICAGIIMGQFVCSFVRSFVRGSSSSFFSMSASCWCWLVRHKNHHSPLNQRGDNQHRPHHHHHHHHNHNHNHHHRLQYRFIQSISFLTLLVWYVTFLFLFSFLFISSDSSQFRDTYGTSTNNSYLGGPFSHLFPTLPSIHLWCSVQSLFFRYSYIDAVVILFFLFLFLLIIGSRGQDGR